MSGLKNVNRLTLAQQEHGDLKPKFFSAVRSILASLSSPLAALLFGFTLTTLIRQQQEAPRNPLRTTYTALNSRQTKLAPRWALKSQIFFGGH